MANDNLISAKKDDVISLFLDQAKTIRELQKEIILLKNVSFGKLSTTDSINAKTAATTTLVTIPAGKTLVILDIAIRCTAFTVGSKSIQAVINIGGNAISYNDYISAKTITISALNQYIRISPDNTLLSVYTASTALSLKITTGSNATTETWSMDVLGYYI